jgi:hypothetical protein
MFSDIRLLTRSLNNLAASIFESLAIQSHRHFLSGEIHSILDTISAEAWRGGLLDKLSGPSGFDALIQQSRVRNRNAAYFIALRRRSTCCHHDYKR